MKKVGQKRSDADWLRNILFPRKDDDAQRRLNEIADRLAAIDCEDHPGFEEPIVGECYRHTKTGRVYRVTGIGIIEATGVRAVIYGEGAGTRPWIRPLAEWFELVPHENVRRARFELKSD